MPVPDVFRDGMARGWKTHNGAALDQDLTLEADVAIIGSGAGVAPLQRFSAPLATRCC